LARDVVISLVIYVETVALFYFEHNSCDVCFSRKV